jgi:hypothetical protein
MEPNTPLLTETPRRLVFSETQRVVGIKEGRSFYAPAQQVSAKRLVTY